MKTFQVYYIASDREPVWQGPWEGRNGYEAIERFLEHCKAVGYSALVLSAKHMVATSEGPLFIYRNHLEASKE